MSTDSLTVVISAIGIVLTLGTGMFAAMAWVVRRIDAVDAKLTTRIDAVDEKLTTRIGSVEDKLSARIDTVEEKLTTRLDAVGADVTDLKIAVARLEGPPRHLLTAAR